MPKLGFSMSEGTLSEWLARDGSRIEKGQPLYLLESDKSVQEVESPAAGVLKVVMPAGGVYPVGRVLAEIL
jgi:pyruvate/2-oxoglutarate dehydrogenase complex dihydrolipoamide acyltransferase (E2) component